MAKHPSVDVHHDAIHKVDIMMFPEAQLLIAVIELAVRDLEELIYQKRNCKIWKRNAIILLRWFSLNNKLSNSFVEICSTLGVDHNLILINIQPLLDEVKNTLEHYKHYLEDE